MNTLTHNIRHDRNDANSRSIIAKDESTIQLNKIKIHSTSICKLNMAIAHYNAIYVVLNCECLNHSKVIYILYLRAVLQTTVVHSSDPSHFRRCTFRSACAQTPGWTPGRRKDAPALRCRLKEKIIMIKTRITTITN